MIYGRAGVGKTRLMATAPGPLIINAESGLLSLKGWKLPYVTVKSITELDEVYIWLTQSHDARYIQTVGIDTISEIAEVVLYDAKGVIKDPRQAYGSLIDTLHPRLQKFRDLPNKNVVFISKQEMISDQMTGINSYGPSFPGKELPRQAPYLPDELFHMGIGAARDGSSYRYLRTQPNFQYEAKDRSGRLNEFEPPDLNYIFGKIAA